MYYEDFEPWEKDVPTTLIPAIKHLRESFDDAHFNFGCVTRRLCYSHLHPGEPEEELQEYTKALVQLKGLIGPVASQRFDDTVVQQTPSAIFKSFLDFYLEGLTVQILLIFKSLVEIGRANEKLLPESHLDWAKARAMHLIRSEVHEIDIWVTTVCDKQPYDPHEDDEEKILWKKWQAPLFLIMKPSRYHPYDAATAWERQSPETSLQWRKMFTEHYVLHLDIRLDRAAGDAAVLLAMQPVPGHGTKGGMLSAVQVTELSPTQQDGPSDTSLADRRIRLWKRVQEAKQGDTVSTEEAAILLGVSHKTINRRVVERQLIPGAKRGRITIESLKRKLPTVMPEE